MIARFTDIETDPGNSQNSKASTSQMSGEKAPKRQGKRPGRKPVKIDVKAKLERSRQSARECRARKKLRYQYIEELVTNREQAIFALREELQMYKEWCEQADNGIIVEELRKLVLKEREQEEAKKFKEQQSYAPLTTNNLPMNTYSQIFGQSASNIYSTPSNQFATSSNTFLTNNNTVSNSVPFKGGASNAVLEDSSTSSSFVPQRLNMSQMSEKEQIYSWYLFLKDDEGRFRQDGSGSGTGTPQPSDAGMSNQSLPSVVTDYLDISDSSDSTSNSRDF